MAEQSGFFDAHLVNGEYDRVYLAESFAKYFASFIGNGIFGGKSNELMVQQKSTADMSVEVLPGQAWINGYWYENDDELSLAIDVADGVLNRIDLIVLRWNNSERAIRLAVKKGTPATSASVPLIQRDADFYELKLAQVYIKAGATRITSADIIDTRLDSNACGLVHGVVDQIDTTDLGNQLNSFINQFIQRNETWFSNYKSQSEQSVNNLLIAGRQDIDDLIEEKTIVFNDLITELERIAADNDLVIINEAIDALKRLNIESSQYPGCFYRIINGNTEWINPPSLPGFEYMLTERWNAKPVYQRTVYAGALSNKTIMAITIQVEYDKMLSVSGYAFDTENIMSYPFPIILNGLTPIAVISGVEGNGSESNIIINVNEDLSAFTGYITIKYTKE